MKPALDPAVLERISCALAAEPSVSQVILFGSRAKGTNRPGSDIDLCVEGTDIGEGLALLVGKEKKMRPSEALDSMRDAIRAIALANETLNPRVFGSVARGEDDEDSDLDLLVDNIPGQTTLISLARIKSQVEELTGIRTDVATPRSLKVRYREPVLREAVSI